MEQWPHICDALSGSNAFPLLVVFPVHFFGDSAYKSQFPSRLAFLGRSQNVKRGCRGSRGRQQESRETVGSGGRRQGVMGGSR
jgi:hypothetical protein